MRRIHVNVKVLNLELSESEEVCLLVDTGSTYTWIPEETLERVGIRRERVREFVTIEGKLVRRDIGMGIVELLSERAPTVLVFAAEGDANVLGIHALEGLGLEYDPVRMELRKVKVILAV